MSGATYWKPHTITLGSFVVGATRAVTGEWAIGGRVKRLALVKSQSSRSLHLIAWAWCFSVARRAP